MGSMSLYRSVSGAIPSSTNLLAEIMNGDQGDDWKFFEIEIDMSDVIASDVVEVCVTMRD